MGLYQSMADDIAQLPLPQGFTVIELGSQMLVWTTPKRPARTFYQELGCSRYESIDGNGEGTIVHDLNLPPNGTWHLTPYDLVTDFGTGEHIFNQAQVWTTVHNLTKVGGYIGVIRPAQGYPGHCFYRTDPCLFLDIAKANSYEIVKMTDVPTTRGTNVLVFYRRTRKNDFVTPQQGRYQSSLKRIR